MSHLCFDVYGQYRLHVERHESGWRVMRVGEDGKRGLLDLVIPPELPESRLAEFLDDLLHEGAGPGESVRRVLKELPKPGVLLTMNLTAVTRD